MFKIWGSCLFAAGAMLLASPAVADDICSVDPDLNGNGIVDEADFEILQGALGTSEDEAGYVAAADLNGDGVISTVDYSVMLSCS